MSITRACMTLVAAVLFEFAFTAAALAQRDTLWIRRATSEVERAQLNPLGGLLLHTEDALLALDARNGETIWKRTGLVLPHVVESGPLCEVAMVWGKRSLRFLDLSTGRLAPVQSDFPPVEELRGYFRVDSKQLLLVFAETSASRATLLGVEMPSRVVRWRQDSLFTRIPKFGTVKGVEGIKEFQWPIVDSDTSVVLYVSEDGPMRIDLRTGEVMWRTDVLTGRSVPDVMDGAAQMIIEDDVLYVPSEKHLAAIRVDDGTVLWNRSEEFRATLSQMELTEYGLAVRGKDKFVNVIDRKTGESRWEEDFRKLKNTTPFVTLGDTVYIAADKRLVGLSLADGDSLQSTPFKFEGDEVPVTIEKLNDAIFLASRQNFLLSIPGEGIAYHEYYKAPGLSFLTKLGTAALAATFSLASPNYNYVPQVRGRFARARVAPRYVYVLTERPSAEGRKGFSLVRLRKEDGSEAGRIWLDDRNPNYVVDPATSTLYLLADDRTVVARGFPDIP